MSKWSPKYVEDLNLNKSVSESESEVKVYQVGHVLPRYYYERSAKH
jgi:hypothetical protein